MGRTVARSQLLLPGLLFLALMLFFVPEEHVNALRGRALSALSPVLRQFSRFNLPPPGAAVINVPLLAAQTQAPEAAQTLVNEAETRAGEVQAHEQLKADYVRLLDAYMRLRGQLGEHGQPLQQPPGIDASVIARKVLWNESILALDHGAAEGVRANAGVLYRGVVAGRIVALGPHASTMALLTHRGMEITARLAECRLEGVLQGAKDTGGERLCRMAVVGRECPAKTGESVVTSGFDGVFPAGLWLGVVTDVKKVSDLQWELAVRPACSENALEIVRVLTCRTPDLPWPAMPKERRK